MVPASAGLIPFGGSYMGATEIPGFGSRPFQYHMLYITTKAKMGRKIMGLLFRYHPTLVKKPGSLTMPLGMEISIVNPPRMGNGLAVSNEIRWPSIWAVASCSFEP